MTQAMLGSLALLVLLSCRAPAPPVAVEVDELWQHWVHSNEEEAPGDPVQVYRPAASLEFPPSRFRMAYKFAPRGDCEFYFLSPDDAHHFKACRWEVGAGQPPILRIIANGRSTEFAIVELSGTVLRLRRLE